MTPEETHLAALLGEAVPGPPQTATDELGRQLARLADTAAAPPPAAPQPGHRRPRPRQWLPVAAGVAVVLAVVALLQATQPSHGEHPAAPATAPASRSAPAPNPTASGPTPSSSTSGPRSLGPDAPWGAQRIGSATLQTGSLLAVGSQLYGLDDEAGTLHLHLVRLDPGTGTITASLATGAQVGTGAGPVIADGSLWLLSRSPGASSAGTNPYTLIRVDPTTLHRLGSTRLDLHESPAVGTSVTADPSGRWLYVASGGGIVVVDAHTGTQARRIDGITDVSGVALSPDGSRLYAASMPQDGDSALYTLDPATGAVLDRQSAPNNISTLVATAGGVWVFGGSGMHDDVIFAPGGDLAKAEPEDGGGGGLDPDVRVASGLAWLGGPDQIGCADPDTGHSYDTTSVPSTGGTQQSVRTMAVARGQLYGIYQGPHAPGALVRLDPPAACRQHADPPLAGASPGSTSTAAASVPECPSSALHLQPSMPAGPPPQGQTHNKSWSTAGGQNVAPYVITNTSLRPCWVGGRPQVTLHGSDGRTLPLRNRASGPDWGDPTTVHKHWVLRAGRAIGFNIQVASTGSSCWTATSITISDPPTGGGVHGPAAGGPPGLPGCGDVVRVAAFFGPVFTPTK